MKYISISFNKETGIYGVDILGSKIEIFKTYLTAKDWIDGILDSLVIHGNEIKAVKDDEHIIASFNNIDLGLDYISAFKLKVSAIRNNEILLNELELKTKKVLSCETQTQNNHISFKILN